MCSINHDLKSIFIHLPKNGGLYIQQILEKYYNFKTYYFTHENHNSFVNNISEFDEEYVNEKKINGFTCFNKKGLLRYCMSSTVHNTYMNMDEEKWRTYYKFTFIRNPYDKIVSAWKYLNKLKRLDTVNINKLSNVDNEFKDFLQNKDVINNYAYFHSFISQYNQLLNLNDELDIQYYGKFENLNEDLIEVLTKLGVSIKHSSYIESNKIINSSKNNINYTEYYDDECIKMVNGYFNEDFEQFDFKKCDNLEELTKDSLLYYITKSDFMEKNKKILHTLNVPRDPNNTDVLIVDDLCIDLKNTEESKYANEFAKQKKQVSLPQDVRTFFAKKFFETFCNTVRDSFDHANKPMVKREIKPLSEKGKQDAIKINKYIKEYSERKN